MFLSLLTMVTALSISAVAIYYSVAGLTAIFAAAVVPIVIMGTVLEVGKLVTAVWLHYYWNKVVWWLKTYLTISVVVLMFITSMGIFGFLSKAHIEQASASKESIAKVDNLTKEIARTNAVIARAESKIKNVQSSGTSADQTIQTQIDREQQRIDNAYQRIQPAINAVNSRLDQDKLLYADQLDKINQDIAKFETLSDINTRDRNSVKRLQQLIGARPDGSYGRNTAKIANEYRQSLEVKKQAVLKELRDIKDSAQIEVKRLQSRVEAEIDRSNQLIEKLRQQLGSDTKVNIEAIVDKETARIREANAKLDQLTEDKFTIEAEYRKLEAEVGPVKYIAEFVYGQKADKDLLEEAVRWVIVIIIFVFDPLAVLLLIASQYTMQHNFDTSTKQEQDTTEEDDREYNNVLLDSDDLSTEDVKGINQRIAEVNEYEQLSVWREAKRSWKEDNPKQSLKYWKDEYIKGKIDSLPWKKYVKDDNNS